MQLQWQNNDNSMQSNGTAMAKQWQSYIKAKEKHQHSNGKAIAQQRNNDDTAIAKQYKSN